MSLILTFEGLDGCGKSTQCRLLHAWLKSQNVKAKIFRFPGFSTIGKRLRRMASSRLPAMSPLGAALVHFSDMVEFCNFITNSSDSSSSVYLCDRFFDSTIAYQGATSASQKDQIIKIRDIVFSRYKPNKTFFLDAEPEILLPRLRKRSKLDRYDTMDIAYKRRVAEIYRAILLSEPRCVNLDAALPVERLHSEIRDIVQELIRSTSKSK